MKILVYSSVFYPNVGGIENLAVDLIREFEAAGHQIKVITEQKQYKPNPFNHVEIIEFKHILSQIRLFFWCDLVFMPNITLKASWLFLMNPFKKIFISHNDFHLAFQSRWLSSLKMFFIRHATDNIAVSKSVADFLNVNAMIVYNCYDDSKFKLYPNEKREFDFVFVGRLVTYKGCACLIEAFNSLGGDYNLSIIGDGPEKENLIAMVEKYRLTDRVRFLGFMHEEALARMLNRHKIMVIPPIEVEGFGIVALEGLACGCEMIVADAGGLSEAIGEFGSKFPMNDSEALAECMRNTLAKPDMNKVDNARINYLKRHTKKIVANYYLDVFKHKMQR